MLRHWLQLSLTDGLGPILTRRIISAAGNADAACNAPVSLLRTVDGIGSAKATRIAGALQHAGREVDDEIDAAQRLGIRLLCPEDAIFPALLKQIPDPPCVLYMKGTLEPRDLNAIAIVGSRKCSYYGREQAERFAALLAAAGFCVISGGARGVDSSAHRGAMSHPHGRTIAVLGSGLDVPYPAENAPLFELIATRGAVLSEYPLGTPPAKENFPRRNRIVSGMSRGVLVIEADERSGALITARQAIEDHNRTVFAVPGRVDNPLSAGPHKLIREGATLVTKLDDLLDSLGPLSNELAEDATPLDDTELPLEISAPQQQSAAPATELTDRQQLIYQNLTRDPIQLDALIDACGLEAAVVMQELTMMTIKGTVKRFAGQLFALAR